MKRLFFHESGPMIHWGSGLLLVRDLNPDAEIAWRMSRWELFKLGCRALFAAIT